jgi:hypothetical protein
MTNQEILAQFGPREAMEYDVVVAGGGGAAQNLGHVNAADRNAKTGDD